MIGIAGTFEPFQKPYKAPPPSRAQVSREFHTCLKGNMSYATYEL